MEKLNTESITLSVELDNEKLKNIQNKKNCELIVYGYLECMIIKNNIFNIKGEETYLLNEKNQKFKCVYEDGYTHIYNHEKLNMLDKIDKFRSFGTIRLERINIRNTKFNKYIKKTIKK